MAFELSKALGYDKVLSNLDTAEIISISWQLLKENEKNFFSVADVQDLKDSIMLHGILQPLLVVPDGSSYRVIAGHRRLAAAKELVGEGNSQFKDVPCIVLPEMSEAMEWATLIQTNTAARELTYHEKSEAVLRMKKQILQLKEEGVKITGNLRQILSEQLEISKTEIARMEVIEKNLIPEAKELLKQGKMSPSAAYAMARTEPDCQREVLDMDLAAIVPQVVSDHAVKRKLTWIAQDCPHPEGWWQHNEKTQGRQLECPSWKKVMQHKDKGHPERCLGCCADCPDLAKCKDACDNAKHALSAKNAAHAREMQAKEILAQKERAKEAFAALPFANIGKVLQPLFQDGNLDMDEVAEYWNDNLLELIPEHDENSAFDGGHVSSMVYPETLDDIDWPLSVFVAFCGAVDQTPNALLGYEDRSSSGWQVYAERKPRLNQKVIVRRHSNGAIHCGEYIYRDGRWFNPGLDDYEMNITGVTHWIECPE